MPHVIYYCYMTNFGSHGLMNIVCYDTHPINDDWIEIHFKCIFGEIFFMLMHLNLMFHPFIRGFGC